MNPNSDIHSNGQNGDSNTVLTMPPEQSIIRGKIIAYLTRAEDKMLKRLRGCANVVLMVEINEHGQPQAWSLVSKRETP